MNEFKKRIKKIRRFLNQSSAHAVLLSSPENIRYLSGFTGHECWLLLTRSKNIFLGDFRYNLQAFKEIGALCDIVLIKNSFYLLLKEILRLNKIKRLYFEPKHLTYAQYSHIKASLPNAVNLMPCKNIVEGFRILKTEEELKFIRKAISITKKSLKQLEPYIKTGISEIFLRNKLEQLLKDNGATALAFEPIVASGPNAAMPHAHATSRKIRKNEPIIIDVGADYKGYKSDLTRTFFSGKITQYIKYYKLLVNAQDRAIKLIRPGVSIQNIDRAARDTLKKAGLDRHFGHALGHGVGIQVHESPIISGKSDLQLKAGMVFTVEPGIYIPNAGGTRIEDMILVTKKGCKVLSR